MQYINAQRSDEKLDNKIKFQQLQRELDYQNQNNPNFKKQNINYQPNNSDGLGLMSKPANLISEE